MNYHDGMIRWCDHTAREECPNSLGKAGPPVQSVVGALTWNPLGTLASLAITDPFYSGGNQSCSYSHDDLTRIASANCGSVWSQTFSYDAFGNISKSGSISFLPTYSYLTNRMTQIGRSSPTYDSNGNVTNDFLHTYAWDAAGRPVTIDRSARRTMLRGKGSPRRRNAMGKLLAVVVPNTGV